MKKILAPLLVLLMTGFFAWSNTQEADATYVVTDPSQAHMLFLWGFCFSLPFYLIPILTAAFTGWGVQLRAWFRLPQQLSFLKGLWLFGLFLFVLESCFAVLPEIGTQEAVQQIATFGLTERLLLFVPLCVLVPLFEEVLYRGILLHLLPFAIALPVSSLLFACAHGFNLFVIPLFLFGWCLALLTRRTQSLLPAMLFHGAFNALTLFGA